MEGENYKFVDFAKYCPTCKHKTEPETQKDCAECLTIPARLDSHKPEKWEKK